MPACSVAVRWCETSVLQDQCQTNEIRSDLESCLGLINVALFPSLLYNIADMHFSFIRCRCRSASERICRLQEALDERKQQFNSMATKYDVLMFFWAKVCCGGCALLSHMSQGLTKHCCIFVGLFCYVFFDSDWKDCVDIEQQC